MGLFWSKRSEQKATSGHVPCRQTTPAVRDDLVREETDTSPQDSQTTIKATSSQTQSRNEVTVSFALLWNHFLLVHIQNNSPRGLDTHPQISTT
ncbi:hypothetical protein HOLleu_42052 [Holothuria leucospilota]|uniref:Uncharacterized protein n=1 Tax=Holothuria leucospilota TaxID=206669 RepID=A0A9Q0YBZ1_HOLLE|nr:hypothetical protein HOLleu_42052 [Holothuria leucospilota]